MTHVRVTIDGTKMLDDNLGDWQARPPEFLKRLVQPASKPEPHLKAVGITMADALLTGQDVAIEVVTEDDGSWSMSVKHSFAIALPAG